jgi:cell division septal protein FtsQ
MSAYFDRKSAGRLRKQRQKRGRIKAVLVLIMLMIVTGATFFGFNYCLKKGAFNIKEVHISGNRMVDNVGLMSLAETIKGRPFWRSGSRELSGRICRKYPAVKRAAVTAWPWGMADIQITERKPVARLQQDRNLLIDAEGVVFGAAQAVDGCEKLPQIAMQGSDKTSVWRSLRLIESAPWVEGDWVVDPSNLEDIKLKLPGGVTVHFGNGAFREGWQKLGEVLENMKNGNLTATEIDLRFNGQAIVKGLASVQ